MRFAVLRAVVRDINAGDENKLTEWRTILLSLHCVFLKLESADDLWKKARQLREDVAQTFLTMRLSALQNIYEVEHFKRKCERLHGKTSATKLTEAFREGITFSDATEKVTDSFVDMSTTIDARMLSVERIAKVLLAAETEFSHRSPFDGVTKLQTIISKAKTEDKIFWTVRFRLYTAC